MMIKKNLVYTGILITGALIGIIYFIYSFPDTFSEFTLKSGMKREDVGKHLKDVLSFPELATPINYENFNREIGLSSDDRQIRFLQETLGFEDANRAIEKLIPVYRWTIRYMNLFDSSSGMNINFGASPAKSEGIDKIKDKKPLHVEFDLSGRLRYFETRSRDVEFETVDTDTGLNVKELPMSGNGPVSLDSARLIVTSLFRRIGGIDLSQFTEKQVVPVITKKFSGYQFTFISKDKPFGFERTIRVHVRQTKIGFYEDKYELPLYADASKYQFFKSMNGILGMFSVVLFSVITLIYFFMKFRKGAFDLKLGMFFGAITAVVFCGMFFAMAYDQIWWILLIIFIFGGIWWLIVSGILVTVSASLSYDAWPEKYQTFEAIKRGKMINRRFAWCLIRAMLYSFILLGLLTFILRMIPGTSVMINEESKIDFGPYNGLFVITAGIFGVILSLHSQYLLTLSFIRKKTGRAVWLWVAGVTMGILLPFLLSASVPMSARVLIGLAQGILFTYIFLKHDFLTLAFSALIGFIVLNGWLFFLTSEWLQVIILGIFMIIVTGVAIAGIFSRETGEDILDYVPDYVKEIENKQRMEREFEIARHIQTTMLCCKTPQSTFLEIATVCDPAYEVGGDYYDFVNFENHPNRIGIVIGDVSGKGVSAAFYMTLAKGILQTQATITPDSPKETLCRVNDVFYEHIQRDKFISMIYAIFDFNKGTMLLSRAGHNPLVIKQSSSSEAETLMPKGIAIGLQKGKRFCESLDEAEIRFKGGDVFVFYTDGFSEAMNKQGEEYGDSRLYGVIHHNAAQSPAAIIEAIHKDVQTFTGALPQHDDMTMIVIKIK